MSRPPPGHELVVETQADGSQITRCTWTAEERLSRGAGIRQDPPQTPVGPWQPRDDPLEAVDKAGDLWNSDSVPQPTSWDRETQRWAPVTKVTNQVRREKGQKVRELTCKTLILAMEKFPFLPWAWVAKVGDLDS